MVTDYVVKALLVAVAILEDATEVGIDSHSASSALEGTGFELDQMGTSERRELAIDPNMPSELGK